MAVQQKIRIKDRIETRSLTRRKGIKAFCKECTGWEYAELVNCNGKMVDGSICELLPYKRGKFPGTGAARAKAIRKNCVECVGSALSKSCISLKCPLYPFRSGY